MSFDHFPIDIKHVKNHAQSLPLLSSSQAEGRWLNKILYHKALILSCLPTDEPRKRLFSNTGDCARRKFTCKWVSHPEAEIMGKVMIGPCLSARLMYVLWAVHLDPVLILLSPLKAFPIVVFHYLKRNLRTVETNSSLLGSQESMAIHSISFSIINNRVWLCFHLSWLTAISCLFFHKRIHHNIVHKVL